MLFGNKNFRKQMIENNVIEIQLNNVLQSHLGCYNLQTSQR